VAKGCESPRAVAVNWQEGVGDNYLGCELDEGREGA